MSANPQASKPKGRRGAKEPVRMWTGLVPLRGYYDAPERQKELRAEAASWIGTPFVPHAMVKGAGVDCVSLCAACYQVTGFLDKFSPPAYPISGAGLDESLLIEWLDLHRQFKAIVGDPQPGDLLCFRVEQIIHHTGLYVGEHRFIHARRFRGVITSSLRDSTYESRLVTIYRPLAPS